MSHFFLLFLSIFLLSAQSKLQMVVEIFRHGAREPIFNYWNAALFKNPGELTSVGMRQHFLLGSQLRKEYIEDQQFLSFSYDSKEIYIRSTDYNRTIMSALSQLNGLYPLGTGARVPEDIPVKNTLPPYKKIDYDLKNLSDFATLFGFQPIPVHTMPIEEDEVLLGEHTDICPINKFWFDIQKNSEIYKEIYSEFENNTIKDLKKILNITGDIDLGVIAGINDVFLNDIFANKPLPDLSEGFFRNMTYIYTMNLFYTYFGSQNQRKFIATPLFKEILGYFDSKINNKNNKKWIMYSAHDSTLGYVYSGFNVTNWECLMDLWKSNATEYVNCLSYPSYASSFLLELHEEKDGFFVKIKVNGEYLNVCEKKQKECRWEEFKERVENFVIGNHEELCKRTSGNVGEGERVVGKFLE